MASGLGRGRLSCFYGMPRPPQLAVAQKYLAISEEYETPSKGSCGVLLGFVFEGLGVVFRSVESMPGFAAMEVTEIAKPSTLNP